MAKTTTITPTKSKSSVSSRVSSSKAPTMEQLLASLSDKKLNLSRNQEIEGEIVFIGDNEVVLDLGTKAEGVIPLKDFSSDEKAKLKVGQKLTSFVVEPESESGQVVLSTKKQTPARNTSGSRSFNLDKFEQAMRDKKILSGRVVDVNKGGLIVETDGMRGFLPTSQVSLKNATNVSNKGLEGLVGEEVRIYVIEVDEKNRRLIFSQRGQIGDELKAKLAKFKKDDKVKGEIVAVLPFGVFLDVDGIEGIVYIAEASWDKIDDLDKLYNVGDKVEAAVLSVDEDMGRLNLSFKKLTEDPFADMVKKYQPDDTVKGKVKEVLMQGLNVELEDGMEGFVAATKLEGNTYQVGQEATWLIDDVDLNRRKVNLSPMLTSTKGLIYK